jgi:hypothetical protein
MFRNFFSPNHINKIGFEDILLSFNCDNILLINTLPINEQSYLIKNTLSINLEESTINEILTQRKDINITIIIYGKNSLDKSIELKYTQLRTLGYYEKNLYIYYGGLFEWALLKDIYGETFATTINDKDILRYKPTAKLLQYMSPILCVKS